MTINDPNAPSQTRTLSATDLQPADVLLERGQGIISDLIASSDGGNYSHGALWTGAKVIQATHEGITNTSTEGEFTVYRHKTLDPAGAAEVVAFANAQVGGNYAYTELVLLGLLFSAGFRVKGALLERVLDAIGGAQASKLKAWLDGRSSKVRVCTELVATCFYHTTDHRFALQILPFAQRHAATESTAPALPLAAVGGPQSRTRSIVAPHAAPAAEEVVNAQVQCLKLLTQHGWAQSESVPGAPTWVAATAAAQAGTRKLISDTIAIDAVTGGQLGVVTPADLQFSPSLSFVGYFKATKATT